MKRILLSNVAAVLAIGVNQLGAITTNDTTGDLFNNSFGFLDITSVEVNNNATDLIFKINLNGDPVATDWGKYMIGLNTTAGGDTSANGNGWTRPISMTAGMDYWIGSWANSGNGAEAYKYAGSWGLSNATYAVPGGLVFSKDTSSVTITYSFANLGLNLGDSFNFDVYTSGGGGGDSAVDSLSNPSQSISDWGGPYSSGLAVTYELVPEPAVVTMLGLGGLILIGRLIRRRN